MGAAIDQAIEKQGGKVAFAKRAGLNRTTLYRLLRGDNVSTEVLLRTLRELGRTDLLLQLTTAPAPSPLELRPASPGKRRPLSASHPPEPNPPQRADKRSLVSQLVFGHLPKEGNDA